jgi:endonuclease YncB( thermonuclease family)
MSDMKIMFTALFLIAFSQLAHAGEFSGEAIYIVDGDTFDIQTTAARIRIRFCGIDSPERWHAGYREAKDALASLIKGKTVRSCFRRSCRKGMESRTRSNGRCGES